MPRVPLTGGPSVRSAAVPTPVPSAETFGPAALGSVARGLDAFARELDAADQVRAQVAEVELMGERDAILGDLDRTGGEATLAFPDQIEGRWAAKVSALEARLSSPRQRELFRLQATRHRQDVDRTVDQRVTREWVRLDTASTEDKVKRLQDAIQTAATDDPTAVEGLIGELADTVTAFGARPHNGIPAELAASAAAAARSAARTSQVEALANAGAVDQASAVLADHRDQFTADDRDRAKQFIKTADLTSAARQAEARALSAHPGDEAAAVDYARSNQVREDVQDHAVQRITARFAERRRLEKQAASDRFDDAATVIEQTRGNIDALSATQVTALKQDRGSWEALTGRARDLQAGTEPAQNWAFWTEFVRKDPKDIAAMNLMRDVYPHVDNRHYEAALQMHEAVRAGKGAMDGGDLSQRSFADMLDNTLAQSNGLFPFASIPPGDRTPEQTAAYARVERRAAEAIEQLELDAGGKDKVTPSQRQQAIDRTLLETVAIPGGWFGGRTLKPAILTTVDDAVRAVAPVPYREIPDADIGMLSSYLREKGVTRIPTQREQERIFGFTKVAKNLGFTPEQEWEGIQRILRSGDRPAPTPPPQSR